MSDHSKPENLIETFLCAAHELGLKVDASAQDVVDAIHSLQVRNAELRSENKTLRKDADRYLVLRQADVDTIHNGGLFAGLTPDNIVINGHHLDEQTDAVIAVRKELTP